MHKKPSMPPAGEAILAGDIEAVRRMAEDGSLLFKKGKVVGLRENIPTTVQLGKKEITTYSDAFSFALAHDQTEIARMLIDYGLVDIGPRGDALFITIRRKAFVLLDYMLDRGGRFGREERDITRLLLNLSDVWDDDYCPALLDRLDLPLRELGGIALCHAASDNNRAVVTYLLRAGVNVNSQNDGQGTPVLRAAAEGHTEMVRFLVKQGADLTITNEYGCRPYTVARVNGHMKTAKFIKSIEPVVTEEEQNALFERYHVPAEMQDYLKTGPLLLEFPEGEQLGWVRLFSYTDVAEISYQGQQLLSLVEDSEDFGVMLLWELESKKVWFLDMEHDVFHAVAAWEKFIRDPGYYINRAVMWEFD
ncbi:MAG: ankyrin repeat domain-containing protein [Clostridiales bacterium]|nr:ankyrin repeat domain-containing protein [Clostridiales bacterium]